MTDAKRAIGLCLICVVSWSFIPVVAKFGQVNLDNGQLLFWSNLLSMSVVGIAIVLMRTGLRLTPENMVRAAVLGFLGCFVYYMLLYYAYAHESAIPVLVVQYSWPALIVVFSFALLGERIRMRHFAGLLLGCAAIVTTATKGRIDALSINDLSALSAVFVGAVCFALFSVLSKKFRMDPVKGPFWFFFFATIYSAIFCMSNDGIGIPSKESLIPVIANGALINGLSYIFWVKALGLISASRIAPLVFLAPVFATVWVSLFFSDEFHPAYFVGMTLCVLSGLLCVHEPAQRSS